MFPSHYYSITTYNASTKPVQFEIHTLFHKYTLADANFLMHDGKRCRLKLICWLLLCDS